MERLISKNFDESGFSLRTVLNKIKNLKKQTVFKSYEKIKFFPIKAERSGIF